MAFKRFLNHRSVTDYELQSGRVGVYIRLYDENGEVIRVVPNSGHNSLSDFVFVETSSGATFREILLNMDGTDIIRSNASPDFDWDDFIGLKDLLVSKIDIIALSPTSNIKDFFRDVIVQLYQRRIKGFTSDQPVKALSIEGAGETAPYVFTDNEFDLVDGVYHYSTPEIRYGISNSPLKVTTEKGYSYLDGEVSKGLLDKSDPLRSDNKNLELKKYLEINSSMELEILDVPSIGRELSFVIVFRLKEGSNFVYKNQYVDITVNHGGGILVNGVPFESKLSSISNQWYMLSGTRKKDSALWDIYENFSLLTTTSELTENENKVSISTGNSVDFLYHGIIPKELVRLDLEDIWNNSDFKELDLVGIDPLVSHVPSDNMRLHSPILGECKIIGKGPDLIIRGTERSSDINSILKIK